MPHSTPGGLNRYAGEVVPRLQQRGTFYSGYDEVDPSRSARPVSGLGDAPAAKVCVLKTGRATRHRWFERPAGPISVESERMAGVRVSAKADYAVRAAVELAASDHLPTKAEEIATNQAIPLTFLVKILHELRMAGLIRTQRGPDGGHELARPAGDISVADVLRAVEGPLAEVRGAPPESLRYSGSAEQLQRVWIALRTNMRSVLESVSLADIAGDRLPSEVDALAENRDSWVTRVSRSPG